jgi:cell division protease FtsH
MRPPALTDPKGPSRVIHNENTLPAGDRSVQPPRGKEPRQRPQWLINSPWFLLIALTTLLLFWWLTSEPAGVQLQFSELTQVLASAEHNPAVTFRKVKLGRTEIRGVIVTSDPATDGDKNAPVTHAVEFRTNRLGVDDYQHLYDLLDRAGVAFQGEEEQSAFKAMYYNIVLPMIIFALMGVGLFFLIRYMAAGSGPLTFGRSRHKVYAQKDIGVTFKDVAGIDEAVAELREVVDFLSNPSKYQVLGGRIPKGVLLVGPPGTGKTLLARAVAGEAGVPFFALSGSDFVEMFVGVGASRVRDLFSQAESRAPAIVFIDELDALGKTRTGSVVGSHDEREQTLNQLLVEMDGFESNRGLIIMAATNRPETLDPALLRPGRFDRTVVVDRPDLTGREAILKVHVRNVKLGADVDLRRVAALTPGMVGADLANLVNEAALMAARNGKEAVTMTELNEAIERAAIGLERKSRIMLPEEKRRVAYHEAGHALVTCALPNTDPVHKVSIIPRGVGTLGFVLRRPEDDRWLMTRSELESHIKVSLGGTIAEELVFGDISNGATSDLENVTRIARSMVKMFGMSGLGRVSFQDGAGPGFLGNGLSDGLRDYSEQTAREIDMEIRKIVEAATEEVRRILGDRRAVLETVAQRLVEKEVIEGDELRQILKAHGAPPAEVAHAVPSDAVRPDGHEPLAERPAREIRD